MKGLKNVFQFTWQQELRSKGYRLATIVMALLLFLLPAGIMPLIETLSSNEKGQPAQVQEALPEDEQAAEAFEFQSLKTVYAADESEGEPLSLTILNEFLPAGYEPVSYVNCTDLPEAAEKAGADPESLVCLFTEDAEQGLTAHVLLPEESGLTMTNADAYSSFLFEHFTPILLQKGGVNDTETLITAQTEMENLWMQQAMENAAAAKNAEAQTEEGMPGSAAQEILRIVLPFINIMLLYFLVLAYGQSVANSVLMEKSSKLMDMFLLYVKPRDMVLGKVLAVVLASILQFLIWLAALVLGFVTGTFLVKAVNPETDMAIVRIIGNLSLLKADSVGAVILAVLLVFAGFLLYSSLAAVGGAIAGKQEDLASTNIIFTLILVISFFAVLYGGGLSGVFGETGLSPVMNWIPFTSIMILPSRLILGEASLLTGAGALVIVLAVAVLVMAAAGKLYRMLALYKGDLPTPKKLIGMLRER